MVGAASSGDCAAVVVETPRALCPSPKSGVGWGGVQSNVLFKHKGLKGSRRIFVSIEKFFLTRKTRRKTSCSLCLCVRQKRRTCHFNPSPCPPRNRGGVWGGVICLNTTVTKAHKVLLACHFEPHRGEKSSRALRGKISPFGRKDTRKCHGEGALRPKPLPARHWEGIASALTGFAMTFARRRARFDPSPKTGRGVGWGYLFKHNGHKATERAEKLPVLCIFV